LDDPFADHVAAILHVGSSDTISETDALSM
jgi:hypothetical protein